MGKWTASGCSDVTRTDAFDQKNQSEVLAMNGDPARTETFSMEGNINEFRVELLNLFPLPANADREIRELHWKDGSCNLTVWFARRDGDWIAVQAIEWPDGVDF